MHERFCVAAHARHRDGGGVVRVEAARRVHAVLRAVDALDLGEASHELLDGARDAAERVGDERDDSVALDVDGVVVVAV